jgi:ABC-type nitrate/sulfonate/bicarbonate transport system substrate-binding protein
MKGRRFYVLLAASLVALVVIAPSSVSAAPMGVGAAKHGTALPTLNIAFGSASVVYGNFTPAMAKGLFKKNGINVNIVNWNTLGTGPAGLVAGQYDLLVTSPPQAIAVANQGKPISVVMDMTNFSGYFGAMVTKTGITSITQLAGLGSNCTIADPGPGGGIRAFANVAKSVYGLGCSVVGVGSVNTVVAEVSSGQVDAAVMDVTHAEGVQAAGKGTIVINPTKFTAADARAFAPTSYPQIVLFGLRSNLQSKRSLVVKFIRALNQALPYQAKASNTQVAKWSLALPGAPFGTTPLSAMVDGVTLARPAWPKKGSITEAQWDTLLLQLGTGGWEVPNYVAANPTIRYRQMVDNSYYFAALKTK